MLSKANTHVTNDMWLCYLRPIPMLLMICGYVILGYIAMFLMICGYVILGYIPMFLVICGYVI